MGLMPTSEPFLIPQVLSLVLQLNPSRILDVGVGFGKWGFLLREYLEVCQGRYHKKDWEKRIDGVEVFKDYIDDHHKIFYDKVFKKDILKFPIEKHDYDLIILGDVIEHLEKKDALKLISKLKRHANLIITTPNGKTLQGESFGNKHETHLSGFFPDDFKRFNAKVYNFTWNLLVAIRCPKKSRSLSRR